MSVKNAIIPIATGIGVISVLILKGIAKRGAVSNKVVIESIKNTEKTFGGIPLSKLTELAQSINHGIRCSIDQWGFLVFYSKSNRGRQTLSAQMMIDDAGKLINLGGHYIGQSWSTADEFAKRANEVFSFIKKD